MGVETMEGESIRKSLDLTVIKPILEDLSLRLDRAGIYYRVFTRSKSLDSIKKKLEKKTEQYKREGKKLQDVIGIRLVFYFLEDVEIVASYLREESIRDSESNSTYDLRGHEVDGIGGLADKVFMPIRLNLVFRMDDRTTKEFVKVLKGYEGLDCELVDNTYEVQLRTVLSEGWHEVEHDLRYKCKDEPWWGYCDQESRMLNGIYASLETSERTLGQLFTEISYKNYKQKDWEAMIRNHLRIKFLEEPLPPEIKKVLNESNTIAKLILKQEKKDLLDCLFRTIDPYPRSMANIVYLINEMQEEGEKNGRLSQLLLHNSVLKGLIEEILGKE